MPQSDFREVSAGDHAAFIASYGPRALQVERSTMSDPEWLDWWDRNESPEERRPVARRQLVAASLKAYHESGVFLDRPAVDRYYIRSDLLPTSSPHDQP